MVVFNHKIFNWRTFFSLTSRQKRAILINEMNKLIAKGYNRQELERRGYSIKKLQGEVKTYNQDGTWDEFRGVDTKTSRYAREKDNNEEN